MAESAACTRSRLSATALSARPTICILILPGLTWIDAYSTNQYGVNFANLEVANQVDLLTRLDQADLQTIDDPTMQLPVRFFQRLRWLVVGAFYSSSEGSRELGYMGNVPIPGDYPGPTPEAMQHLNTLLDELGLEQIPTSTQPS